MTALDPPTALPVASAEPSSDVIEVIGKRTNDTPEIDRRSYQIRETPQSAQKDALQLLRGLPAVTVTPDDRLLVLGAAITRLYVDGRPFLGDIGQYLHTLHGSDIARIEVITNPSAQFSSEGAGGVINLILRKTGQEGVSGNASYEANSWGYALVDTTINAKAGDWTYQLKASANVGRMLRRTLDETRRVGAQASATANRESGLTTYDGGDGRVTAKVTHDLDAHTTLSAQARLGGGHDITVNALDFTALTDDFEPFSQHTRLDSHGAFLDGQVALAHTGTIKGEALNASVQAFKSTRLHDVTRARYSDGRWYRIARDHPARSLDAKLDWKHPMGSGQMLSTGASFHVDALDEDYAFTSNDAATLGADTRNAYAARSRTLAAYATFQQAIGRLTLAPGLRGETNARRITSPDEETVQLDRTRLFPSFHASFEASKALRLQASYSRRIERVPLEYLASYGTLEDAYTRFEGNPALKDESIDSYELGIQLRPGPLEASATLYWRRTSQLWSESYTLNSAGTSVYTYVNAGNSTSAGGQLDLGLPLTGRLKLNASANLFDESTPLDTAGGAQRLHTLRYTTNGTLEWSTRERGATPGDVAQVQWSWNSAAREYQIRKGAWFDASLAYTHSVSPSMALTGTLRYSGTTRERLVTPLLDEDTARQRSPRVQIKLYKTF
ncbi:TonB-dependent receptor [Novosphingobium sp. 1949]|uniref:TonB-dependent receptor n=1 Tax=Novosphingobium organovorum TaxID=2930092 RepID=A0ABT0BFQ1_9SPHN|nr:TonB-dependent receptor [Novosphingobium organovorum]MCJ2183895.1 TonB-dependent receptor [Novosphingobium organovorum]